MVDKLKQSLEFEALENRVAPVLVSAPAPEPVPDTGGGGFNPYPPEIPQIKHDNPGWLRKMQEAYQGI